MSHTGQNSQIADSQRPHGLDEAINKMNLIDASIAVDVRRFNTAIMFKSHLFGESMN